MAVVVWYGCSLIDWSQAGHKISKGAVLGGSIVCGAAIYLFIMKLSRSEETLEMLSLLRRKLKKG